jgi:hypothetical protein
VGLLTKDGVPRNLLRLIRPALGPDERVLQTALLSDYTRRGTDMLAGDGAGDLSDVLAAAAQPVPSWIFVLTERQVFLFRLKRDKNAPPPTGYSYQRVRVDADAREIEPRHVHIALDGGESRRFEVPELWRRQIAVAAAVLAKFHGTG